MNLREFPHSEMLVHGVSKEQIKQFEEWLFTQSFGGCVGYSIFKVTEDGLLLRIDSSLNHSWYEKVAPILLQYFSDYKITGSIDDIDTYQED